ncbi:DUF1028 domain-containing protein [Pseudonocardia acaciae]|uniref:DUF1028 domain-containing protein n=1 Tax=Pseudonocardia acaciae TaxID=551276 RepID=UPI00049157C1|nr:DUF1028 domain-containing protein [Pseudonocardia acaciae]
MRASTFSIVGCDLDRREWGVAIASKFLAVGALCAWVQAEVGAVATQSFIRAAHGPHGLRLLAEGTDAERARDLLLAGDEAPEQRQLGLVDARGRAATFTGAGCLDWAGGRVGPCYAAQGNMLVSEATVDALATTFEAEEGQLADRLLAALEAGQAAGGDRRGQQAAALLVARGGGGYGGADVAVDLRVDDHPTPVAELRRLYGLHGLYFGTTPDSEWLQVDDVLRAELAERLARAGHRTGDLDTDLATWAGIENLEERVHGTDRIDPVVLASLREATDAH